MRIFNYLFKSLLRNQRRTLTIILGITVASSLIIGINLSMDALGYDILSKNFQDQTVDLSIHTERDFFGNFSYFTDLFNSSLTATYPDIHNIFGAIKFISYYTIYEKSKPINWTFYEQLNFDWRWFNQTIFFGLKPDVMNQERLEDIIQFQSLTGGFFPFENEVYIEKQVALQNNISIGDNLTFGNYFWTWYPIEKNYTYSIENITVSGFYTILDQNKFDYLFPRNWVYGGDDPIQVLTSEEFAYTILTTLWNNISNFEMNDPWQHENFWHIALVIDHASYDYLNPHNIERFYNRLITDIVYTDLNYDFIVTGYALELIQEMELQVLAFKAIASIISIPVLMLAWVLIGTNYHVVFNNRRREIGLLKTRFFTNAKLRRLYFSESVIFGSLGGITGIGFGLISARYIYGVFSENTTFFTLISLRSFLSSALMGVILGIVLSLIASIKPTITFSQLKTIESLQKYNIEVQTRPLRVGWWDWLLLIITSLAIISSIVLDPDRIFSGPMLWQLLLYLLLPFFSVILPLSPFILSWEIAKFFSTYSLGFFTTAISRITRFFNHKTDFFVTRSITRNRWRSTRIVAIIAIALSFLFIADITASTEIQYQQNMKFVYTAGDAAFEISSTNLTRTDMWEFANSLMAQENLSISHSSILSVTNPFQIVGSYIGGSVVYLDPTNYVNHICNIDRFFGDYSSEIFNTLHETPNGTIVPSNFLDNWGFKIGDRFFIRYLNNTNSSIEITQELEIVGMYELLPGINPYSYNHIICKDIFPFYELDFHNWLVNYNSTESLDILNAQVIDSIKDISPSLIIRSIYSSNEDSLFSLLTFLDIEKYYFVIFVAIGIGITMFNSIQEKSLDFGILRARGVEKWTIVKIQLSEGLVYLTLGVIISLSGLLSAWALNNAIEGILESVIPRYLDIPIWRILIELGSSILIFSLIIIISSLFVLKQSNVKKISDIFRTA